LPKNNNNLVLQKKQNNDNNNILLPHLMYFVRYVIRSFREPAHSHTDKFKKKDKNKNNFRFLQNSYNQNAIISLNAITLYLSFYIFFFLHLPSFLFLSDFLLSNIFEKQPTPKTTTKQQQLSLAFNYPLSIRIVVVVCADQIGSFREAEIK